MTNFRAILGGTLWMMLSITLFSVAVEPVQDRPAHAALTRPIAAA